MNADASNLCPVALEEEFQARKQEFFALYGHLASRFSAADAFVGCLLEYLINPENPFPGGLVTRTTSDREKTVCVRQLAAWRYRKSSKTLRRIQVLMNTVDCFRDVRNLVIHGMWSLDPTFLRQERIPCFDFRWKKAESRTAKSKSWSKPVPEMFTFDRLRRNADDVDKVGIELAILCRDLGIPWMEGWEGYPEEVHQTRTGNSPT